MSQIIIGEISEKWNLERSLDHVTGLSIKLEKNTPFVKCEGSTSSKRSGLDYKWELTKIHDLINS